jgi:hypothetical protein
VLSWAFFKEEDKCTQGIAISQRRSPHGLAAANTPFIAGHRGVWRGPVGPREQNHNLIMYEFYPDPAASKTPYSAQKEHIGPLLKK